jgi:hypothetical protein
VSQDPNQPNQFDPFSAWGAGRDAYLDSWSKAMIEMVNSPAYAEASAKALDNYLSASAPFRSAMEKAMAHVLSQLNLPSRTDITNLAERLTSIEMRLDDLDAKIDDLQRSVRSERDSAE